MERIVRMKKRKFSGLVLPAFILLMISCQKSIMFADGDNADHPVTIQFNAMVDGEPLVIGNNYKNSSNEDYSVSNFKFYISQAEMVNTATGNRKKLNGVDYILVDFADLSSTRIVLRTVSSKYNQISFLLGVDSIRNVSGAQTGALDPAKGMFWTWNSGYIMAKLEGNSPVSSQPNRVFEYHIGGFSGLENVLRKIELRFPLRQEVNFETGKSTTLTITANVNSWFEGSSRLSIASTPVCTTPGPLATTIAHNYYHMFNLVEIISE